jgi:TPR repeat protein
MDRQEAAALMERGRDLLVNGDVALAQLAFRRLAEAGNADAALALATTYDPRYLAERKLIGISGNEAEARAWYRRASQLGSTEADRILQALAVEPLLVAGAR